MQALQHDMITATEDNSPARWRILTSSRVSCSLRPRCWASPCRRTIWCSTTSAKRGPAPQQRWSVVVTTSARPTGSSKSIPTRSRGINSTRWTTCPTSWSRLATCLSSVSRRKRSRGPKITTRWGKTNFFSSLEQLLLASSILFRGERDGVCLLFRLKPVLKHELEMVYSGLYRRLSVYRDPFQQGVRLLNGDIKQWHHPRDDAATVCGWLMLGLRS